MLRANQVTGVSRRRTNVTAKMIAAIGVTRKAARVLPTSWLAQMAIALILLTDAMETMIVGIGVTKRTVVIVRQMS